MKYSQIMKNKNKIKNNTSTCSNKIQETERLNAKGQKKMCMQIVTKRKMV